MEKQKTREPVGDEAYIKVAYIGLRNDDGSYMINVPLYVKISEVNAKSGMSQQQEELIHRISEKMMRRYEKHISEFVAEVEKKKGSI